MSSATPSRPLLSACLIVKDEEEMIARALTSLAAVADEIVVLDTGSTDDTVVIARSLGATVHEGEWHDDFGRARNEALAHCSGRWVLSIDADEELLVGNADVFRRQLRRSTLDAYTVRIHNIQDVSGVVLVTHDPVRLFRRDRFRFEGRIHERPMPLVKNATGASMPSLEIKHYGYIQDVIDSRDKINRNIALAEAAWAADPDSPMARLEVARILSTTDRDDDTLAHVTALREAEHHLVRHTALHLGVQVLLRMRRFDEALEWSQQILDTGAPTALSTQLHAETLTHLGRLDEALAVLEDAPVDAAGVGVHGNRFSSTPTEVLRGRLLATLGRDDEATEVLLAIAPDATVELWPMLLKLLLDRDEMDRAVPPFVAGLELGEARALAVMAELRRHPVELGDAFCEELSAQRSTLPHALAFVQLNAERLDLERALYWSGIARAAGSPQSCPLVRRADDIGAKPSDRILAAALAIGTYEDDTARFSLRRTMAMLPDGEIQEALYVIAELAPSALPDVVTGFVTSQRRATVMAEGLSALGAIEQAVAVLHYGLEECAPDPASTRLINERLSDLEPQLAGAG